jgi:2OG-Fe dioxygenase
VSDDSAVPAGTIPADVWQSLRRHGYAITDDESIGLPPKFRENFRLAYFTDQVLRRDEGDWPIDRKRARDVIHYWWSERGLRLEEYGRITITDRADIEGEREHARIRLLEDPEAESLVQALLSLVPVERREAEGTFGINLFRTYTNVVTAPHRDNEQFIILYVLNRIGSGAESYLYEAMDGDDGGEKPVLEQQLDPGQILIFEDERFRHGATPLVPPPGETAMRDVLVCTVDYRTTYLEPAS